MALSTAPPATGQAGRTDGGTSGPGIVKKGLSVLRDVTATEASSMVLDKLLNPSLLFAYERAVCARVRGGAVTNARLPSPNQPTRCSFHSLGVYTTASPELSRLHLRVSASRFQEEENVDTETQEEHHVIPEAETGVSLPQAKEHQGSLASSRSQEKVMESWKQLAGLSFTYLLRWALCSNTKRRDK
ncbi:uncharacterized protein [Odocoileus virginianus]|uniref:Uncharacterized protein isoform X2 n=1 Tax=Odocoileus virginianus TaxID=9874 RepID=A0ABM4IY23_ODOVR